MTPYGPPVALAPLPGRTLLRVLFAVELVVGAAAAAALTAFVAHITWTGCFISCEPGDGNQLGGGLLWLLAVVVLCSGPVSARAMWRSRELGGWAAVLLGLPALLVLTGGVTPFL